MPVTVLEKRRLRKRKESQATRRAVGCGCGVRERVHPLRLSGVCSYRIVDGPAGAKVWRWKLRLPEGMLPPFEHLFFQCPGPCLELQGKKPVALAVAEPRN